MKPKSTFLIAFFCLWAVSGLAEIPDFVVSKQGDGDFKTIQEAINAVPDFRKERTIIYIKNGVYKEKLILPATKTHVTFIGQKVDSVILTFDDYASKLNRLGEEIGTSGSASFFIFGEGFTAKNITFENSAGPVGQAVAVRVAGDKAAFFNCRFLGFQDTLYTWGYGGSGRQYYKDCYIEGTVDFIFGSSTAVFDNCHLYAKDTGYFTAASTPDSARFGYVFRHCTLDGNGKKASFYLGRPWRPHAKVVFLNCNMSDIIKPEGWNNWGNRDNERTVFYAEYNSVGVGAVKSSRVSWSRQLNAEEAMGYTLKNIFKNWQPVAPKDY